MYYNPDDEFVNTHSQKIDEKYFLECSQLRLIQKKDIHKGIYNAGIDFPKAATLTADSDCAGKRNGNAVNVPNLTEKSGESSDLCPENWGFSPHHILRGNRWGDSLQRARRPLRFRTRERASSMWNFVV